MAKNGGHFNPGSTVVNPFFWQSRLLSFALSSTYVPR